MTVKATIWHYPRCSKCRKTLAILRDEEVDVTVRQYRDDPPDLDTLTDVVDRLDVAPRELVRTNDSAFAELDIDEASATDQDWLELMVAHPALIQRPVVIIGEAAIVARPPESVYEIL